MAVSFSRPAFHSQAFVTRCRAEPKIKADNGGRKVTAGDIARRLEALWGRACSHVHPDVNATSWQQLNANRAVPLECWLTDATDLLLMCARTTAKPAALLECPQRS